jgi:hypothetical protein
MCKGTFVFEVVRERYRFGFGFWMGSVSGNLELDKGIFGILGIEDFGLGFTTKIDR